MTAFFIPKVDLVEASAEVVYARIRRATHAEMGHRPQELRIFKLSARHRGVDIEAEVGKPDPVCGETVLAILDLGRRWPYVIHCGTPGGQTTQTVVDKPVYAVTEFAG